MILMIPITGFKKTVETLDDRTLLIQTVSGEVIKNGDIKPHCVLLARYVRYKCSNNT